MEDFHRAGGLLAVLREVVDLLDPTALTVTGRPLVEYLDDAQIWDPEVIRSRSDPLQPHAGIAVLYGSLAPTGAVIKPAAASEHLLRHRGRAVVFDSIEDFHARIDDPDLDVDADSVLVLRGCGPKGYPGMPEVANMPLPRKLLEQGVRDMVRICDGRMSGTAYGTVVLHVSPEAAAGGPLGLVRRQPVGVTKVFRFDTNTTVYSRVEALTDPRRSSAAAGHRRHAGGSREPLAGRSGDTGICQPVARLGKPLREHGAAGQHRRRSELLGRREWRSGRT